MSCIKGKGGGGGRDSSWTLEGLSEAMDPRGREGKGCNTCTWHGQCIRYPTNARNSPPPSPPPLRYFERTKFPRLFFSISPTLPSPPPPPPPLPPGACMQSANVKCNICLSIYLSTFVQPSPPHPSPSSPDEPSPGSSLSVSFPLLAFLPGSIPLPRPPLLPSPPRLCIYRMCMNFIDSCQSLVSGREGCREGGREGKKNDGGRDARDRTVDVHRSGSKYRRVVFSRFFRSVSFFLSFVLPFLSFFREKKRISNCFHPMIEREREKEREYIMKERIPSNVIFQSFAPKKEMYRRTL